MKPTYEELEQQVKSMREAGEKVRAALICPNGCRPLHWDSQFGAFCRMCRFSKVVTEPYGGFALLPPQPRPDEEVSNG